MDSRIDTIVLAADRLKKKIVSALKVRFEFCRV